MYAQSSFSVTSISCPASSWSLSGRCRFTTVSTMRFEPTDESVLIDFLLLLLVCARPNPVLRRPASAARRNSDCCFALSTAGSS